MKFSDLCNLIGRTDATVRSNTAPVVLEGDILNSISGGEVKCSGGNDPKFLKCEWDKAV